MPDWSNGSDASFSARRREFNSPIGYYMAPSTNRHRSSPFQGGNGSSSLLGATVVVAEMAMQRIVVPRVETLNASSNLVDHPKHAYHIIFRSKQQCSLSLLGNRKSLWVRIADQRELGVPLWKRGDGSPVGCRGVRYPELNLFESGGARLQNLTICRCSLIG